VALCTTAGTLLLPAVCVAASAAGGVSQAAHGHPPFTVQGHAEPAEGALGAGSPASRPRRVLFGRVGRFDTTNLTSDASTKVVLAYRLAVTRVASDSQCSALFTKLGADGLEKLGTSAYYATPVVAGVDHCGTTVAAYTFVGSPTVMLCPAFATLSTVAAARILIHEALHFAGLGERPGDPHAPMSEEINEIVTANCHL
jgi:hypothetical protein